MVVFLGKLGRIVSGKMVSKILNSGKMVFGIFAFNQKYIQH